MPLDPLECTGQPPMAQNRLAQRGTESTPIPGHRSSPQRASKGLTWEELSAFQTVEAQRRLERGLS